MMSLAHHELMGFTDQQFGNYRLIKRIGHGGFADVYLARHIYVVRRYAVIKVLRGPLSHRARQRFQEEASMLMSLDHQHIVRVFDFGIQNGTPYIIMQLATNGSLRAMYPEGTKLPLPIVLRYLQQVADALTYLHGRSLVHHDIKPENILLDANHHVLLADFGLATMIDKTVPQHSEDFAGTVGYTAPERFHRNYMHTPASDQYSLGIVVYELLTGRRPFLGSAGHIIQQHLHDSPLPLHFLVPDIPLQVERIVLKALRKDPAQRFSSTQAFVDALRKAYESSLHPNVRSTWSSSRHPNVRTTRTASSRSSSAIWRSWEWDGLDVALATDLLIAMLASAITYLLLWNKDAAWSAFAFCTFVVPIVHAFARKKLLGIFAVFSTMLLSVVASIVLNNLFLLPFIQFILLGIFSVAASIHNSPQHR